MTVATDIHRLSVATNPQLEDARGTKVAASIKEIFNIGLQSVRVIDLYTFSGGVGSDDLERLGSQLFANPVVEIWAADDSMIENFDWLVEIGYRPGVTDNPGRTARGAVEDVLGRGIGEVYTSKQYLLKGNLDEGQVKAISSQLLYNELIERCDIAPASERAAHLEKPVVLPEVNLEHEPEVVEFDLGVPDEDLQKLNAERTLALNLEELHTIRDYFNTDEARAVRAKEGLPEGPTDVELEALAQTWSEHCKHKIFNADVTYVDGDKTEQISSLFKTYIKKATDDIGKKVDWLVSVFTDNAGIIKFTDDHNLVMKVETHNSPSALDPYGGAMTGIVGVNRDTFGTGIGSSLIFNTDVFCFASPFYDRPLPPRLMHPRRIFEKVRQGVEHGGNKMGIPTVNGSLVFDDRFLGKPLVYCGTGGLIPAEVNGVASERKDIAPGDLAVMVGGRIGADGIHGATFSSEELHAGSPATAVQIGDPITQKKMFDFLLEARDQGLYKTLTDNGAGGLSSSIGEMAQISGGCEINLEKAPLKYPGLDPWEILISEAQERMTVVVPEDKVEAFMALSESRDVESSCVGVFTDSGKFQVRYNGKTVGLMDMEFLHDGVPTIQLSAIWKAPALEEPDLTPADLATELTGLLGRLNICSKERTVRQYDHEVQGTSVVKPLTGAQNDGPSDAAVIRPLHGRQEGVVVSHGIIPRYSDIDTYHMTANVIDEAVRNAVAVGADPDHLAGLDNFCWCDPVQSEKTPDGEYKAAQLVRSNKALYDYCVAYQVPCISGKDSMKNDYIMDGVKISIPPTLLFSVVGKIGDVTKAVTMDVKRPGDLVYVLGTTSSELGGSEYYAAHGHIGASVPKVDAKTARKRYLAVHQAISAGLVASAHDCSDGGLGVALAESAFAGGYGMKVDLQKVPTSGITRDDHLLFSESASRLVVTVRPENQEAFETVMKGTDFGAIGEVTESDSFEVTGLGGDEVITETIGKLKAAWQEPLGV